MLNKSDARKITEKALANQRAYERTMIENDANEACKEIEYAASRCCSACEVDVSDSEHPADVAKYLSDELGFGTEYNPSTKIIRVSW